MLEAGKRGNYRGTPHRPTNGESQVHIETTNNSSSVEDEVGRRTTGLIRPKAFTLLFFCSVFFFALTITFISSQSSYLSRSSLVPFIGGFSDFAIAICYFIIPISIAHIGQARKDLSNTNPFILLFAGFILSCGIIHLLHFISTFHDVTTIIIYAKIICALISIATAISCYFLINVALAIPTHEDIADLEREKQSTFIKIRQMVVNTLSKQLKAATNQEELAELVTKEFCGLLPCKNAAVFQTISNSTHSVYSEGDIRKLTFQDGLKLHLLHTLKMDSIILKKEGNDLLGTTLNHLQTHPFTSVLDPTSSLYVSEEITEQLRFLSFSHFLIFQVEHSPSDCTSFIYFLDSCVTQLDLIQLVQLEQLITQVQLSFARLLQLNVASEQAEMFRKNNKYLIEAKEFAERASKSKSDFLATVSHDIRTPMNAIVGMARILEDIEVPEEAAECISILSESSNAMLSLIDDILDFSTIENGKARLNIVVWNLPEEIHKKIIVLRKTIPERSPIEIHFAPISRDIPVNVIGERNFTGRVISNLLRNAIKFTSSGSITVSLKCTETNFYPNPLLKGELTSIGNCIIQVDIQDTGKGVAASDIVKLFEPFERLSETTTEGSGLGLTICKRLVDLMGGTIWVESTLGVGSTFSFKVPFEISNEMPLIKKSKLLSCITGNTFPKYTSSDVNHSLPKQVQNLPTFPSYHKIPIEPNPQTGSQVPQISTNLFHPIGPSKIPIFPLGGVSPDNDVRILVVDDNYINRKTLSKLLNKLNFYTIDSAENGVESLEMIAKAIEEENPYNCVFMDLHMPIMGGLEACRIISERDYAIPNLYACTANASTSTFQDFVRVGVDQFIAKPINFEKLRDIMQSKKAY